MAGTFTHWLIADEAKEKRDLFSDELWRMLNRHHRFLCLGAVGPDMEYLSFHPGGPRWSNHMHYLRTDGILRWLFAELKADAAKGPGWEERWIWLMGYGSHLVADAAVHPVVQAAVGPYVGNETAHRLCEMTQDALLYREIKKDELTYGEYTDLLRFAGESPAFDVVMTSWARSLSASYPEETAKPNPALWFTTYKEAIDTAEGGSSVVALFRHLGGEKYFYSDSREIERNHPKSKTLYYDCIQLPHGKRGCFFSDVFQKAVIHVAESWLALWLGLSPEYGFPPNFRNWNLDTGVDQESPEKEVTFWS